MPAGTKRLCLELGTLSICSSCPVFSKAKKQLLELAQITEFFPLTPLTPDEAEAYEQEQHNYCTVKFASNCNTFPCK